MATANETWFASVKTDITQSVVVVVPANMSSKVDSLSHSADLDGLVRS